MEDDYSRELKHGRNLYLKRQQQVDRLTWQVSQHYWIDDTADCENDGPGK